MKKIALFVGVFALAILAASALPLFGNSSAETSVDTTELEALAPISEKPAATATRAGCGGSCCGGQPGTAGATADKAEAIKAYLTDYYEKEIGGSIEVVVKDLGCHHEADILQSGVIVARLSINGGVITRIG
jgi:hypothetical protein